MKFEKIFGLFLIVAMTLAACKNQPKQAEQTATMQAVSQSASVEWTAYKTTEKVPVKGTFKSVTIQNTGTGATVEEVANGTEFAINDFEISTNDTTRDATIVANFFKVMDDAGNISGKVFKEGDAWFVKLKLNGITVEKLPAQVSFEGNTAQLTASIQLADFNALNALASLNKACGDLHKGADGISKTWDVVDVKASLQFEQANQQ